MVAFRSIRRALPINSWKEISAVYWNVDHISDGLLISERGILEQLPADGLALPLAAEGRDEGPAHLVAQWHGPHPSPPSLLTRYDRLSLSPCLLHSTTITCKLYLPYAMSIFYIYPLLRYAVALPQPFPRPAATVAPRDPSEEWATR